VLARSCACRRMMSAYASQGACHLYREPDTRPDLLAQELVRHRVAVLHVVIEPERGIPSILLRLKAQPSSLEPTVSDPQTVRDGSRPDGAISLVDLHDHFSDGAVQCGEREELGLRGLG
jgi:hypothetical protein